jgi:hypothetical protein
MRFMAFALPNANPLFRRQIHLLLGRHGQGGVPPPNRENMSAGINYWPVTRAWSEISRVNGSGEAEEIVASLLASLLVDKEKDKQDLLLKALFEAQKQGLDADRASLLLMELRAYLERIL